MFANEKMNLQTGLSVHDCKMRLLSSVDIERLSLSMSGYAGSKDMLGKIQGNKFRLQKRRNYRNSFAPFFYGQLTNDGVDTLIVGEFRIHPAAKAFMAAWFAFLLIFSLMAVILHPQGQFEAGRVPLLAVSVGMMVFGVALVMFSRWLARGEQRAILDFLKVKLEAREAN
jgi:hypothetical protein